MMNDLDFKRDKDLARDFLLNLAGADGEPEYIRTLQDVANHKTKAIQIDLEDLIIYKDFDEEFLRWITENSRRYVGIFSKAIDELMLEPTEAFPDDDHDILMIQRSEDVADNSEGIKNPQQKMLPEIKCLYQVYVRASSKGRPFTICEVKASYIGQLVKISGIVTHRSDVKPLMQVVLYTCKESGFEIYQGVTARVFMPLFECPSVRCRTNNAKGNLILQLRASKFLKFQEGIAMILTSPACLVVDALILAGKCFLMLSSFV